MKDTARNEDTTARASAGADRPAERPQTENAQQNASTTTTTRDHLPPILISDGSFVVEIRNRLSPLEASGSTVRPHRYRTVHVFQRILIIDGHGDVRYKNDNTETCELHVWLMPHQPHDPPQVIYKDVSEDEAAFEIDEEFESPDANTVSRFRPHVYRDPRGADTPEENEVFFVYRVRVIKANEILYQFIADPFHQEGLQIWIWDELR